ncbi:MAG: hypothetical protein WAK89_20135 [Candidatus Sulfotelmatobacter sp.]
MVKPPLRTKSIGFKVSEEEYAQLETAAQADGRTLGEWCREVILRGGSGRQRLWSWQLADSCAVQARGCRAPSRFSVVYERESQEFGVC